jgi:hypothetical protein
MFSLASLPLIYVYSFSPKSELIGFINFFVVNVIACFLDMVLSFIAVFSQGQSSTNVVRVSKLTSVTNNIRWIVAVLFPSVNLKHSLFNIRLKSNQDCVSAYNILMLTNYSYTGSWISVHEPGVGIQFIIFCVQMIVWWIILTLIEKGTNIKLGCRRCCKCDQDLEQLDDKNLPPITRRRGKKLPPIIGQLDDGEAVPRITNQPDDEIVLPISTSWNDAVCR